MGRGIERTCSARGSSAPIPADALTCFRLARWLALAVADAPDYPLVLGTREDLVVTAELIDRLLERARGDVDLRRRAAEFEARWRAEAARLLRPRPRRRTDRAR